MTGYKEKLLNERNELIAKCRPVDKAFAEVGEQGGEGEEVEDDDVFPVGIF